MRSDAAKNTKHLLLVCYFYPPDGGAGTQRPLAIARHAAACGWRVTVLTRALSKSRGVWDPEDASLHERFEHVNEIRVPVPEGSKAAEMIANAHSDRDPWLVACTKEAVKLRDADAFDHVLVTMPPYGMAPLASMIRAACPGTPVSIDLRDPWAFDGAFAYASKRDWKHNMAVMRDTLNAADGIVVNTPEVLERVAQTFPEVDRDRLEVVTNGFEPDLFDSPKPGSPKAYDPDHLHLVHIGTLHSSVVMRYKGFTGWLRKLKHFRAEPVDIVGRTAIPIMQAIGRLKTQGHPGIDRLRLVLVGVNDDATQRLASESGCKEQVLMTGYMDHDEAVAWARWAECLFLPLHGLPDGHRSLIVPGKTYEYLASQRPILGALPEGDARAFLEASGRAYLASPCDVDGISKRLAEMLDAHANGSLPAGEPALWVTRFSRPALTERLFVFLDRVGQMKSA
jgi:glycosyltransferase involved in cell wall biosynthesis